LRRVTWPSIGAKDLSSHCVDLGRDGYYEEIQMKVKICSILTICFFALLFLSVFGQESEVPPVEFKKLSDRLYLITGGLGANSGAFIGDNGVLIIEGKADEKSVDLVLDGLKKITDKPVLYLVNTHYDLDHCWGNQFYPESVIKIAHENLRKDLYHPKGRYKEHRDHPQFKKHLPSVTFRDKMDILLGSQKVELWYFGKGHSTGDIVVYFPGEQTAFVGDQVFLGMTPGVYSEIGGNTFEHVKTLNKMMDTLDAEQFISGHYNSILSRADIWTYIDGVRKKQEKVRELLNQGYSLEKVKNEFPENDRYLVESMYSEIKSKRSKNS
jgi:cyclase